ncbi:hypothetical protein BOX15_Mlig010626g1 [Macrostomum lignano]|uniref:DDHD domain-containing protein n=1 Tax=Macrostomum lignano TaxID=282301 RepID=A0A267GK44_9PLAT|nr:hypothetical protein BOX15_Mlig010626g1 [Macrostomum lignano]
MHIKEYRICMPMSVEEYRIAQLYMIQKKSREESTGTGSGVEIIKNEPYEDGPGPTGKGQYTFKIYHVGSHLPSWFRAILPKSALRVEEEAWNAYPYTKTRYKCPFVEKFLLEIETVYRDDPGSSDNVFDLRGSEKSRQVDYIDIVRDPVDPGHYTRDEDPRLFVSEKTGRGPLDDGWRDEAASKPVTPDGKSAIMCSYKLCRVEFRYWGMQTKIERFIHDVALRKTMLRAHRQAWAWQDEWVGLTMADIRQLEAETAAALQDKMAAAVAEQEEDRTMAAAEIDPATGQAAAVVAAAANAAASVAVSPDELGARAISQEDLQFYDAELHFPSVLDTSLAAGWKANSIESIQRRRGSFDDEEEEEEFFDAASEMDTVSFASCSSPNEPSAAAPSYSMVNRLPDSHSHRHQGQHHVTVSAAPSSTGGCRVLFLVLHGGSVLDTNHEYHNKHADIATLRATLKALVGQHYRCLAGRFAVRLVSVPPLVAEALQALTTVSPYQYRLQRGAASQADASVTLAYDHIPMATVPLLFTSSPEYASTLAAVAGRMNERYKEFLASPEGRGFNGQVCIIGDSTGGIVGYDVLTRVRQCRKSDGVNGGGVGNPPSRQPVHKLDSAPDRLEFRLKPPTPPSASASASASASSDEGASGVGEGSRRGSARRLQSLTEGAQSAGFDGGEYRLEFDVSDLFLLGCPLALVLAYRRVNSQKDKCARPACGQVYNLFHTSDPCSFRMEPLLADRFRWLAPVQLPKYSLLPCGDGQPLSVLEAVTSCGDVFLSGGGGGGEGDGGGAAGSSRQLSRQDSNSSSASSSLELSQVAAIQSVCRRWWGPKRLDYSLHCPDTLSRFPINAMPLLFHASYWESADAAAFILRQFVDAASVAELLEITDSAITESSLGGHIDDRLTLRVPGRQREKWRNRANAIKLKNAAPNHRANDVIVAEGQAQVLTARFMYGPFDMLSLSDEVIDVHVMSQPPSSGEWSYVGSCNTDSHGKAVFSVPAERRLPQGVYPVKMVARGDHSSADLNLAVLPPATECVVFSVDGSFAASVSIMGADPKVRPGAVDVVRHWQDLGYLLVYISARPDMQQRRVVGWLAQHNFPHGMVFFMDGFTAEPLRQKTACLTKLAGQAGLLIHAAYGSSKDIAVYQSLNLRRGQIFIIGKAGKKHAGNATILSEGYAAHLSALQSAQYECSRPAQGVGRHVVRRGCFGLPQPSMSSGRGSPSAAATSDSSDSAQQQNQQQQQQQKQQQLDPASVGETVRGRAAPPRGASPLVSRSLDASTASAALSGKQ